MDVFDTGYIVERVLYAILIVALFICSGDNRLKLHLVLCMFVVIDYQSLYFDTYITRSLFRAANTIWILQITQLIKQSYHQMCNNITKSVNIYIISTPVILLLQALVIVAAILSCAIDVNAAVSLTVYYLVFTMWIVVNTIEMATTWQAYITEYQKRITLNEFIDFSIGEYKFTKLFKNVVMFVSVAYMFACVVAIYWANIFKFYDIGQTAFIDYFIFISGIYTLFAFAFFSNSAVIKIPVNYIIYSQADSDVGSKVSADNLSLAESNVIVSMLQTANSNYIDLQK